MIENIKITPKRSIGPNEPCFIIAEIGQNHNGSIETAKKLILEAKLAGADCVKFQKSNLEAKFTSESLNQIYESPHSFGITYGEHKKHLEFSIKQHQELLKYANELGIIYSASAMDEVSYFVLRDQLKLPFIKIGSGDANNYLMLEKIARDQSPPLIISTGMQTSVGIQKIASIFTEQTNRVAFLHCVSAYPTPAEECRLRFIEKLQNQFPGFIIGYSGHEATPIVVTLGAVALGAKIIERHITLDKSQKGNDHKCSLTPTELRQLCHLIRRLEKMKLKEFTTNTICETISNLLENEGISHSEDLSNLRAALAPVDDTRRLFDCELPCFNKLGKTLVYNRNLIKGNIVQKQDMSIKVSPVHGMEPENSDSIIGRTISKNVSYEDPIKTTDFV